MRQKAWASCDTAAAEARAKLGDDFDLLVEAWERWKRAAADRQNLRTYERARALAEEALGSLSVVGLPRDTAAGLRAFARSLDVRIRELRGLPDDDQLRQLILQHVLDTPSTPWARTGPRRKLSPAALALFGIAVGLDSPPRAFQRGPRGDRQAVDASLAFKERNVQAWENALKRVTRPTSARQAKE